jgi:2-amino-4-hydroxy-6-hydroxymethyldihydropteridine diphosphokinase
MTSAVIALGSNLGDREANLRSAVAAIAAVQGVQLTGGSGIVESRAVKPNGVDAAAPQYLNAVVLIDSDLAPVALLDELNRIEAEHGRVRDVRWGDRTLDLDLLLFGDEVLRTDRLTLPHPRAADRAFVVVPWLQADPDAELPGYGRLDRLSSAASDDLWEFAAAPLVPTEAGAR